MIMKRKIQCILIAEVMLRETLNSNSYYFHHLEKMQIEKLKLNIKPKTKPGGRVEPRPPF